MRRMIKVNGRHHLSDITTIFFHTLARNRERVWDIKILSLMPDIAFRCLTWWRYIMPPWSFILCVITFIFFCASFGLGWYIFGGVWKRVSRQWHLLAVFSYFYWFGQNVHKNGKRLIVNRRREKERKRDGETRW